MIFNFYTESLRACKEGKTTFKFLKSNKEKKYISAKNTVQNLCGSRE